jgi:hypothetical protein
MKKATINPKTLFLIDGMGALLSALLLGVILVEFESLFGMPPKILYFLSSIAVIFALYDFVNYARFKENRVLYLRIMAILNLLYCCLTAALVIYYRQELTYWGKLYFLIEMGVVIVLAVIEFKTAASKWW